MEQKKDTFLWRLSKDLYETSMVFPIDYTANESIAAFGQNSRGLRDGVLRHPFFKDTLQGLFRSGDRTVVPPTDMPPIPLEAVPLLECFYHLAKQAEPGYHKDVFLKQKEGEGPEALSASIMERFEDDLYQELYQWLLSPRDKSSPDLYAYCRHILFKKDPFRSAVFRSIWVKEISPRYDKLWDLVQQASAEQQIETLKDHLISLDRMILNLQSKEQPKAPSPEPCKEPASQQDSMPKQVLQDLLSVRNGYKGEEDGLVSYRLPNLSLEDGTTLEEAFQCLGSRKGRPSAKRDRLLPLARKAYLLNLSEQVKGDSALEERYAALQKYLTFSSFQQTEEAETAIRESCIQYCQRVIAYCTYVPAPGNKPAPHFAIHNYSGDLMGSLFQGYMNQAVSCFQDIIQLAAYYCAGQMTANRYYVYEQALRLNAPELENKWIIPILPSESGINYYYHDAVSASTYIQRAWDFLYPKHTPLFDKKTHRLLNADTVAADLWRDGTTAAKFFGKKAAPFSSEADVRKALDSYDRIVLTPHGLVPPILFWNSVPGILHTLLLQIMQRIVEDSAPKLTAFIRPHFHTVPQEEAFQDTSKE